MSRRAHHLDLARLFGSAVASQIVLSAANFATGVLLVRHAGDLAYGSYVLAGNALLLLGALQGAFFGPPLALRFGVLTAAGRADLIGGLYRSQGRLLPWLIGLPALAGGALWLAGRLDRHQGLLGLATLFAAVTLLRREYFRMVLSAYRLPQQILVTDLIQVAMALLVLALALQTPWPATVTIAGAGLAALVSSQRLEQGLRRVAPWNAHGAPGLLRRIAGPSSWSALGAAVHWTFAQGFLYAVAIALGPLAVAALATTRLLLMPVNLLANGIGSLLLPMGARWLADHGVHGLWRRCCLAALGLAVATLSYFACMWLLRDWLFRHVLHKSLPERDALLLWWGAAFLLMVVRDRLVHVVVMHNQFRLLTTSTAVAAVLSLAAGWWRMPAVGAVGALQGLLLGELVSIGLIVGMTVRLLRRAPAQEG